MINGFDINTHAAVIKMAENLADIFEEHSEEESITYDINPSFTHTTLKVSDRGLEILGDAFEEVIPSLRSAVFTHLLDELKSRDIKYDIKQFKGKPN